MGLVLRQGAFMTVAGLALGLGAAAASVRYLAQFRFGVTPFDVATFVLVGAALLVVALVACGVLGGRTQRAPASPARGAGPVYIAVELGRARDEGLTSAERGS